MPIYSKIQQIIKLGQSRNPLLEHIAASNEIVEHLKQEYLQKEQINLNFICTHNSRRSQFCQVWAYVLAYYLKLPAISTFSSGTEETRVYPTVITTLREQGFIIKQMDNSDNPEYSVRIAEELEPLLLFSKTIEHDKNPSKDFSAIMTCSSADESCPTVHGASARFKLTFEDPKYSDGTVEEKAVYEDKSIEIATTLFHIFKQSASQH